MKRWTEEDQEWLGYKRSMPAKITLPPAPWEKKSAANMSHEEFSDELVRLREKALHIDSVVGTRQDRSYRNQKRGKKIGY